MTSLNVGINELKSSTADKISGKHLPFSNRAFKPFSLTMHLNQLLACVIMVFTAATALPAAEPGTAFDPNDTTPYPGDLYLKSLSKRADLVSFNNYNNDNCQGKQTPHTPQTKDRCHTITTRSLKYYSNKGSCQLYLCDDSLCSQNCAYIPVAQYGCWGTVGRHSYIVHCWMVLHSNLAAALCTAEARLGFAKGSVRGRAQSDEHDVSSKMHQRRPGAGVTRGSKGGEAVQSFPFRA